MTSPGVYTPSTINNNTGAYLGAGSDENTLLRAPVSPITRSVAAVVPTGYIEESFQGTGTRNYIRTSGFITVDGIVQNLNGIDAKDFTLTANTSVALEQASSKYARKLAITSINNKGVITYGATNGTRYGLYPTSGTPVDTQADAAKDPYGTPPNFVVLEGKGVPTAHSFTALTLF